MFNCFYSLSRFCSDVCGLLICTFDAYFIKLLRIRISYKKRAFRKRALFSVYRLTLESQRLAFVGDCDCAVSPFSVREVLSSKVGCKQIVFSSPHWDLISDAAKVDRFLGCLVEGQSPWDRAVDSVAAAAVCHVGRWVISQSLRIGLPRVLEYLSLIHI